MLGKTALPKLCKMAAVGGGACSPRGAHAAPGCPEAWSGCLPPALLPPLPPPLAPSSLPWGGVELRAALRPDPDA